MHALRKLSRQSERDMKHEFTAILERDGDWFIRSGVTPETARCRRSPDTLRSPTGWQREYAVSWKSR
jgi:hypothetical protein